MAKRDVSEERAVAARMAAISMKHLSALSPQERRSKLQAFTKVAATLPANPPSDDTLSKASEALQPQDYPRRARGKR